MIIIKLNGGLGNQMFQYALGKNLSYIKNTSFKLDISQYQKKIDIRQYGLNNFNISENFATEEEIKKFQKHRPHFSKLGKIYDFLFSNPNKYIKEKTRNFDSKILNSNNNVYLDGFWQSEKYFSTQSGSALGGKNIKQILRKEFTLKNQTSKSFNILNQKISEFENNSVAIHVRHGDYSRNPKEGERHTALSLEYYKKAIEKIDRKISNSHFFIFSDDIEWCKQHFDELNNIYFVDKNLPDYETLIAISKCKHQIIANSSFSWWGAWLNSNPNKIVIAPAQWYNNLKINISDRLPKNWIRIIF
ncbi:MAG: alpha-1,2-fucosyltransferase [Candidatus Pacebacteria bacterium]|nr:alpha-1,2-fucosyltransferase [Candidatus Paceibacterota bacterium]